MKAKELRLNNWVKYLTSGDVCLKTKESLFNVLNDLDSNYPLTKPIPLTEEWLVKFGFEIALNGYWNKKEDFMVELHNEGIEIIVDAERIRLFHITYVHQLQNLYFALTGEELNIQHI